MPTPVATRHLTIDSKTSVFVIDVPKKIWRPRIRSSYKPPLFNNDVDEGIFLFESLGRTAFRPLPWKPGERSDIIHFNAAKDNKEFSGFKIDEDCAGPVLPILQSILHTYWYCFASIGIKRVILGYQFGIDTGDATPICCRKPHYGFHESTIIMKHIRVLLANDWIEEFEGGWGVHVVLAPKPHQEKVVDIDDFVWRMCVSYRGLNRVTNPFEYPIGRCDSAIEDFGDNAGKLYFICLDKAQGYHQIGVKRDDRVKLAFFGPDNKKYTFKVMPFGPMNAPSFYTSMIRQFQDEWTLLFLLACNQQRVNYCNTTTGQPSGVCSTMPLTDDFKESCCGTALPNLLRDDDYILNEASSPLTTDTTHTVPITGGDVVVRQQMAKSKHFHVTGTRTIIDDIVCWSISKSLALLMLECMCRVSLKYRASFKLSKCDFFFKRFEYVGHDIMPNGNTTAKSKYNLINNWALPLDVDNLHSFVCLCNYYSKFCPLFSYVSYHCANCISNMLGGRYRRLPGPKN